MNIDTDGFSAMIGPTGNLVRLFHKSTQCDVLHWCDDERELLSHPQYYGVPLIFPPNRTAHGQFRFQGRIYQLPVNDPAHDFNVHGFLLGQRPKSVIRENDRWIVQTVWEPGCPGFAGYPHTIELTRTYRFESAAVWIETVITNRSKLDMPYGIGFHTAFAAPQNEDVFIRVPHNGMFWQVDPDLRLPDGSLAAIAPKDAAVLNGEAEVSSTPVAMLLSAPLQGTSFEIIRPMMNITFTADRKFGFFAVWNAEGKRGMICLEPMSWMTNAPNSPLPYDRSGVRVLLPDESVSFSMSIKISSR